ncbi:hypothetical protein N7495_003667 [Penicillium taxi]|uniref:uncharacterized protein n=1 Tax=Penicillium taxi TaxID=168475 RepID=UPI002544DF4C|nr:uncharacterized protein N7495_003667 [Penicillium taxi]KAJ5898923.1 hypothetical protein N7495_003667 [Penicillium taxi]
MIPRVTSWNDLGLLSEDVDPDSSAIKSSSFGLVQDDNYYYGKLSVPKAEISLKQLTAALNPIPDEEIFPP